MKDPLKLWTDICKRFAEQSTCRSRQVGCIIVKDSQLMSEGWNSPPKGSNIADCVRCNGTFNKGEKLELAQCAHAEANAIGYCARKGVSTEGAEIYCTHFCCKYCADLIIAAGITKIFYNETYPNTEHIVATLERAGVAMIKVTI